MDKSLVSLSKFLSLILRHEPAKFGVELDESGWTSIESLLDSVNKTTKRLDFETLIRVVHENDTQRFAISSDGLRIRANQGHSVDVDLKLVATAPPEFLFHGTVAKFIASIANIGLIPGNRTHVHLSANKETALAVGRRRGEPVILSVKSGEMHNANCKFYVSANGVWLTQSVPPEYLLIPS